jgi:predicted nuclease of predicted toxin-antitoxin system
VKVLLDECVDWRLARDIVGHDVKTARQMGWTAIKNGELLALASRQFEVFVTVDRNLSFQQNLVSYPIAIIVLCAKTNRLAELKPLIPKLVAAIESALPGGVELINAG